MPKQILLVSFSVVEGMVGMLSLFPDQVHIRKAQGFLVDEEVYLQLINSIGPMPTAHLEGANQK